MPLCCDLIHEYMESTEDLLEALIAALQGVQVLVDVRSRMAIRVQGIEDAS